MLDLPWVPFFSLREGAVACDARGLTVGAASLLRVAPDGRWTVRPIDEINCDLSACYGLPVDASDKAPALASVARALEEGDLAFAGIAALLLRFPDPPSLEKGAQSDADRLALAEALWRSGLLKDWDPAKHPRTGEPPNPGQFASVPKEDRPARRGWPPARVNKALRNLFERLSKRAWLIDFGPAGEAALGFLEILDMMTPEELNEGEDRLTAQWKAALDPPKTLEELQEPPMENAQGFEQHHVVEQNPSNVEKREIEKFGREVIDDPSNLVWIPRLKHEQITAFYNSKPVAGGPTQRQIIGQMDFDQQRAIGLELLREEGVLK